jgi:hypothetical protein
VQRAAFDALPRKRHLNDLPRTRSTFPHKQGHIDQFGTGDHLALDQLVRGGYDQDQFIFKKRLSLDIATPCRPLDESERNLLLLESIYDVFGIAADQGRVNTGVFALKLAQKPGQHILSDSCGCAKGELARVLSAERGNVSFSLKEKRANLLRISEKNTAGLCQGNVRPGAIEELNPKILFKCLYLKADCRLRKVQLLCSLPEALLCRNCTEDYNAEVFEACHRIFDLSLVGARFTVKVSGLSAGSRVRNKDHVPCSEWRASLKGSSIRMSHIHERERMVDVIAAQGSMDARISIIGSEPYPF